MNKYTKQAIENGKKYKSCPVYDGRINIDDIDIKDIHKDMSMYNFIGKTIEKLLHTGEFLEIKFTDGTYGHLGNSFPITHYGRDTYTKHSDEGELNLYGYTYYKDQNGKTIVIELNED